MIDPRRFVWLACFLACAPLLARGAPQCGTSFVEHFDFGLNEGNWVHSGIFQGSIADGGNPGFHVLSQPLLVSTPRFQTTNPGSLFCGDWRARDVSSIGIDFIALELDPAAVGRPLMLALYHDNGTPGDASDDPFVLTIAGKIPERDGDWYSYSVDVPSTSTALPAGWTAGGGWTGSGDALWNAVMTDVQRIAWFFGDPQLAPEPLAFRISADNARIAFSGGGTSYCIAQASSLGCSPALAWFGVPSASAGPGQLFLITGNQLLNQSAGILIYSYSADVAPLFGGYRCIGLPLTRTAPMQTGGASSGTSCTGFVQMNFNALIAAGTDPLLVPGATVHAQIWSRDPLAPLASSLTNALRFTICP